MLKKAWVKKSIKKAWVKKSVLKKFGLKKVCIKKDVPLDSLSDQVYNILEVLILKNDNVPVRGSYEGET